MKKVVLVSITVLMTSACITPILNTKDFNSKPGAKPEAKIGIPYYLPKALIPLTITLEKDSPKTNGDKAAGNSEGQKKEGKSKQEEESNKTNSQIGKDKKDLALVKQEKNAPEPASQKAAGKPEDQPSQSDKPSVPSDKPDSPPVFPEAKIGQYVVTMGAPMLIPDTMERYFLEYQPESATEDEVSIGVGMNQLLQTTKATSIDKSGEALLTIAKIGIEAAKLPFMAWMEEKKCNNKFQPVKIFTYIDTALSGDGKREDNTFHPFSLGALNTLLEANKVPMKFELETVDRAVAQEKTKTSPSEGAQDGEEKQGGTRNRGDAKEENRGILFRASKPYVLKLSFGPRMNLNNETDPDWCVVEETRHIMAVVPDKDSPYAVDVSRGALITKKTDLTIVNGMLTKIDINKPSSLVGVLNVPLEIIKLVLSAPKDLLTFRFEKIQAQGTLTQAQSTQLKNEIDRLNNEKALREALDAIETAKKSP